MPTEPQLPDGVPPLRTYYMYITGGCNLACRHCWISPTFLQKDREAESVSLPFELFETAVREAEPLGLTHIKVTGGEPFVHPEILRMLRFAAERELGVTIETNGTLITEEVAEVLARESSVSAISVSLDGAVASSHEYIRGVPGSFQAAQTGIRNLVARGYRPQVIMSLFEGNVDEIEPLARWASGVGCSSLKLNVIQETGRGRSFDSRVGGVARLLELGRWVENDLQRSLGFPVYFSWPPAFQRLGRLAHRGGCSSCDIFNIVGVLHTGDLSLCGIGVQTPDLIFGRLGRDDLAETWCSHPTLERIRAEVPRDLKGICGDCLLRDACLGFCLADNYHRTGDLLAPFWFCTLAEEAGRFPRHRKRRVDMAKSGTISSG